MAFPTSRVKPPVTFPALGDRVQQEQYGAGTVTLLDVYHTVVDFDGHGLRRFVTNRIVVERTDDPLSGIEIDGQPLQADECAGAFRQCQALRFQRKLSPRKSIWKAGAARHSMSLRLAVKVAVWCSTV